jgi:hypothetical protein
MSSDPAAAPQGKKRRKSISSPQTDAVLRRWSRSPQAAASDAVPMSPLRGAWASSLVSSPTQPAPKQAAKKHCTDARRHNKGSSTRKTWLLEEKLLWIDRVHFERPADREAPLQAVLIRKCLERNGYAFCSSVITCVLPCTGSASLHRNSGSTSTVLPSQRAK